MKRVLICGYAGAGNYGDELLLSRMKEHLGFELTVLSRDPELTQRGHSLRAIPFANPAAVLREMKRSDFLVLGGGTLLQRSTSVSSLLYYSSIAETAALLGLPFALYGGIDDTSPPSRAVLKAAKALILRDSRSVKLSKNLGFGGKTLFAPDPALIPPGDRKDVPHHGMIISAPRFDDLRSVIAAAALSKRTGEPHALFACSPLETDICRRAARICGAYCFRTSDHKKSEAFLCGAGAVFSSRLHPCITAYSAGIPFAAFSDDGKIKAFVKDTGNSRSLIESPFDPDLPGLPGRFDISRLEDMQKRALNGLGALSDIIKRS